jgi:hypothetical protein
MGATGEQQAWIIRMLGIDPAAVAANATGAATDAAAEAAGPSPHQLWLNAKEQVDGRLEALARELRSYDDPDLAQVADYGLFGLANGRETVGLTAALMDYDRAGSAGRAAARAAVTKAVGAYRAGVLDGSDLVDMVDDNPFDVAVDLRGTLGGALREIERAVA